ncbi:hypothetical protein A3H22_03605 [Candidatus Peribacteria bacterium RIFCSPLOWO2_12_FULL_55_15]|nr:MAG: hypothetical protein A2789_01165 [Candidatus Peribacteria bacterium RIFCSPHIGHO2_01_FULL_54_22]OGJ63724.1 MAG: hypothetical protein A3D12_03175 [Candidatus Peribacteria bacterium RIFCSPHIGHO2_02_FULL_55_24]OGJ64584.1 MAG: hypothetical protein A3E47_01170 [Candidatus Peribacteria bacterium RIFCSPHIGHO2_12_FULL_54_10]OGJ68940.1 MAG: hypothetical protein A3H90_04000 [Candidatus Peribacteria bacterium RIFCSPLOWO2_02_FULL_55_36]OGJ70671.1 MAG: hypothetical protein A3H22_03605 [Candidatus Per
MKKGRRIGVILALVGGVAGGGFLFATVSGFLAASSVARVDWQQTAGPIGGVVNRMKLINGEVWASLYSGGIYKFADNRWQQIGIGHGLPENRIFDFVIAPDDPKTIYAAQLVACLAKSTDGGKNWKGLCDGLLPQVKFDNYSSKALAFDPKDNTVLYVAGKNERDDASILMSPDRGKTWKIVHDFAKEMPINNLVFFHDRMYLATENDGVYRSDDRGKRWIPLQIGLDQMQAGQFVVDPDWKNLYLFTGLLQYNVRGGGSIYVLDEAASRWKQLGGPEGVTSMTWGAGALWAGNVAGEIWRRDAKGWTLLNRGAELPSTITEMAFTNDMTLFVGARGFGIYHSKDLGKTFEDVSTGLTASATREVYVNPVNANQLYVISWDRPGIYISNDGGASFTVLGKDVYVESMMPQPQDFTHVYAAGMQGFYDVGAEGTDGTWQERKKPGPPGAVVKTIAIDPSDAKHLLVGLGKETAETPEGYGVYVSRDSGKTWKKASLPDKASYSILFNPKDPKIVYVGFLGGGIYKSKDGGETFSKIKDDRLKYTYRMAMSAGDPNVLLAGSNLFFAQLSGEEQSAGTLGGLFKSTDGGATWKDIIADIRNYGPNEQGNFNGALSNFGHMPNYEQMLIDPRDHRHMLIGHHGENVFMTNDDGKTWEKQKSGMIPEDMHNYAYCLGADASFKTVYACTCGRGLFRGVVSPGVGISWRPAGLATVPYSFPPSA